jgi:hypothetical protein
MQDSIVKKEREDTMMWHEREIEKEKNEWIIKDISELCFWHIQYC